MMRRRLDAGKRALTESVDEGIDIDWLVIADDAMPVKIIRGQTACLSTLDFAARNDAGEVWNFSDDSHVHLAWQAIRQVQPGLTFWWGSVPRCQHSRTCVRPA